MEQDPMRVCELLVGLGDVDVVGGVDEATNVGGSYPDTVAAGVWGLRRGGALQRHQFGAAGGFAGVRACGTVGVAQASLVLPGHRLCDGFVHRNQRRDRTGLFGVDIPGGALGNNSGGS